MTSPPDSRPRLLLVEDSEDTRLLLALALGGDGWQVDEAADAFQAAKQLRSGRYDLLVADYDLPGKTGAELIREAFAEGLLAETRTVMVTAHPDPLGVDDLEVFRKPLDLGTFLRQMRHIRDVAGAARDAPPEPGPAPKPQLELVLYVSTHSLACARALQVLRTLVPDSAPDVRLTVCDLATHPGAGEADNVVFTPTLVKRLPTPRTWILGDLSRPETVGELLRTLRP
jgi:CheY-like chemotaxis protein